MAHDCPKDTHPYTIGSEDRVVDSATAGAADHAVPDPSGRGAGCGGHLVGKITPLVEKGRQRGIRGFHLHSGDKNLEDTDRLLQGKSNN